MATSPERKASMKQSNQDAAIRRLCDSWSAAVNAQDLARMIKLVTDDVVFLPPDSPPVVGKRAIEEFYRHLLSEFRIEQSFEIIDVFVSGDRAFVWGSESLNIIAPVGSQRKHTKLDGMTIMLRQPDDSWKISHGINNMLGQDEP
jgi:uncharacterized protein (TIGR02246 family)